MIYNNYFGLTEAPFSIAVDPRYLFLSARHKDALAHLLYGVGMGGGFILLTGEVGTGKTMLNRCLLEQLPDTTDVALVLNPALNAKELLATVCDEFEIAYPAGEQSLKTLTDLLHRFLVANHQRGRNTVLLIDEAQHLQVEVLEQIRLLTNLETHNKKLLQIILVGQPELEQLLARPQLRQLAQRITARYKLKALNLDETHAYIRHRLHVAGMPDSQQIFNPSIVKGIYQFSGGIPRLVNILCERLLIGCYGQHKTVADRALLKQAVAEVQGEELPDRAAGRGWWMILTLITGASVAIAAALFWLTAAPFEHARLLADSPVVEAPAKPVAASPDIAAEPAPEKAPAAVTIDDLPWPSQQITALHDLVRALGVDPGGEADCPQLAAVGWRCESAVASSWADLKAINRPAVLELISPSKFQYFAALLAIEGERAMVAINGDSYALPLPELGLWWTGQFQFLWRPAPGYQDILKQGDQGPMVTWLAEQFALLDGQSKPLAQRRFTPALEERVRLFQTDQQLKADGVVGQQTMLRFNEAIGRDTLLIMPRQPSADLQTVREG